MTDPVTSSVEVEIKPEKIKILRSNDSIVKRPEVGTPIRKVILPVEDSFTKDFNALIERSLALNDPLKTELITFMQQYVTDMAPGTTMSKTGGIPGANYQLSFCRMLIKVIEKSPPEDFRRNWIIVLSFFWQYKKAALGERYINRFSEYWMKDDPNLTVFQRLMNLCLVSANPETRGQVLSRVDIVKTTSLVFTETGKQNVLLFYKA